MKWSHDIAVARPLSPVIGSAGRSRSPRRRRAVPLDWRRAPPDRDLPALNLTIRPLWRIDLAIRQVLHEHAHVSAGPDRAVAAPRSEPGRLAQERLPEPLRRRLPTARTVLSYHRHHTSGALPAQSPPAVGAPPRSRGQPGVRDQLHDQPRPSTAPAGRRLRRPSVMLHGALASLIRSPAPAAGGAIQRPAAWDRAVGRAYPLRETARVVVPGSRLAWPRAADRTLAGRASPVRATEVPIEPVGPRPSLATILTAAPAALAWRSAPQAPAAPARRRPPAETAWAQPSPQHEAHLDLALLARALGTGGLAAAVPTTVRPSAARDGMQQAILPDTGRLVDEVMERIDRRLRNDRLRRGL